VKKNCGNPGRKSTRKAEGDGRGGKKKRWNKAKIEKRGGSGGRELLTIFLFRQKQEISTEGRSKRQNSEEGGSGGKEENAS